MNRKQKKMLRRIAVSAVLLILVNILPLPMWAKLVLYAAAYVTIGWDILRKAALGIGNKQIFDTTYKFDEAIIQMPDGKIISGDIDSWKDFDDGDQIQVKIDGTTYLVHSSQVVLIQNG